MSYSKHSKVHEEGLDTFKSNKSSTPNPTLCLINEVKHEKKCGFGFQTWKFEKPPKSFILIRLTD
jgi:hypothetical protein